MLTNNIQRVEFVVTGLIFTLTERFRYQRCSQAPIPLYDFQTCASIFSANTSTKSIAVVAEGFSLTVIHYAKGKVCVTPCYGRQASANREASSPHPKNLKIQPDLLNNQNQLQR